METILRCCFAVGVDVAMLESEEKAHKKEERYGVELTLKYRPR